MLIIQLLYREKHLKFPIQYANRHLKSKAFMLFSNLNSDILFVIKVLKNFFKTHRKIFACLFYFSLF